MSTTQAYEKIKATAPADLQKSIMKVLDFARVNSPGINVTKHDLILNIYGKHISGTQLTSSTEDRQIRDAIADLQLAGYPIIASSGKPGYRLAAKREEIEEYVAELEARVSQLQSKIFALRKCSYLAVGWESKYNQPEPPQATQPALI